MKIFKRKIDSANSSLKAFSLIQFSIMIVIISIMATSVLLTKSSIIETQKTTQTLNKIDAIYKALGNYLVVNKKLPCPASLLIIKSNDPINYGLSVGTDGTCSGSGIYNNASNPNLVYGMVPIKSLALNNNMAEDDFESKIAYMVDRRFTISDTVSSFGFGLINLGSNDFIIIKENAVFPSFNQTSQAIFALISYGSNKYGAFNANSNTQNSISPDIDEQNNLNDNSNNFALGANFDNILSISPQIQGNFDDIILYKTRTQLLKDFNALNLISCPAASENLYGTTINWPQGYMGQIVLASTNCPNCYTANVLTPTKQCQDLGSWGSIVDNCVQIHGTEACP
jgi:type II secretory pathway pseudopilin PulG